MSYHRFRPTDLFPLLETARAWLWEAMNDGAICPCCDGVAKVYKRIMRDQQVVNLIMLYRHHMAVSGPDPEQWEFVHVRDIKYLKFHYNGGERALLSYDGWALIEALEKEKPSFRGRPTRCSGFWRLTKRGVGFVLGELTIPAAIFTYLGRTVDTTPEQVTVREALGEKFDYQKLMAATYNPEEGADA